MSAFMVGTDHINAMLHAARAMGSYGNPFTYYFGNPTRAYRITGDEQHIGEMLHAENARSMMARYPQDNPADYELPAGFRWGDYGYCVTPTPVETLKMIACYRYQACEAGDWDQTEAAAFCETLQSYAINALPGYDEAPWNWSEAGARKTRGLVTV